MGNKKFATGLQRKRVWSRYYDSKTPNRTSEDWVHKECLNCGKELILEYKRRKSKFCNLSCSTSYRNKQKASHKKTNEN